MAIGITNAGGSYKPVGFLLVNYPAGATLTVTNTHRPIAITSTQNLYYVKIASGQSSQTCVITLTNGVETVTKTVTVNRGQQVVAGIDFNLYVFYDGTPAGSSVFTLHGGGSARSGANYYGSSINGAQSIFTTSPINTTIYSTLHFKVEVYSPSRGSGDANICIGLNSVPRTGGQWGTSFDSGVQYSRMTGSETFTVDTAMDISTLTGNWYFGAAGWMANDGHYDIYRLWLEY